MEMVLPTKLDAFPMEFTQWADADGDGYGDNPNGYLGDMFPTEPPNGPMQMLMAMAIM